MGYDPEMLQRYFSKSRIDRIEATKKLLAYNYEGKPCTFSIRNTRRPTDLTGMHFGRLKAVEHIGGVLWRCECECGNTHIAERRALLIGDVSSCGCGMRENQRCFYKAQENGEELPCMKLTYKGRTRTVTEWANCREQMELGIKRKNIYNRIRRGWSIERTLTEPNHKMKKD